MLFLPGASGHGSFWDPIRSRLSNIDSDAVDWPGLGDIPADPAVNSYEDLVARTIEQLDERAALLGHPTVVVGQSMGGWIAARAAVERPELVDRLVLIVTSAGVDMEALGAADWRPGARQARPDAPEWSFARHPPMEEQLRELPHPVLLIWADADPISPLAVGERLHSLLPNSELVVFESTDHWVAVEYADEVAARIASFVSQG
jgi:pimeloyl-ACP methyl ester carboxylesterase